MGSAVVPPSPQPSPASGRGGSTRPIAPALRGEGGKLTLVIDIGKSHAKLLFIDDAGAVVERHGRDNRSVTSALGYPALDVAGIAAWMRATLTASALTRRCARVIPCTHGAAFVALGDEGLAWEPVDYEFSGVDETRAAYQHERDDFDVTLSPDLPDGLNAARPLFWMQHRHPEAWARTRVLLPYPQYWAGWLSGVAASEVSSLGCHTQLWRPVEQGFSDLAVRRGWAALFAPIRPAGHVLGPVCADMANELGLPAHCEVHVGVHDSNACLARYLGKGAGHGVDEAQAGMTLVSTGTWVVVMAPGASAQTLDPARDMLANVSVNGDVVPTARFMGGRELAAICAGAAPTLASAAALVELIARDIHAWPSFAQQGGPFIGHQARVTERGVVIDAAAVLSDEQRATLGALYCAQVTALLLQRLGGPEAVMLEGPFAANPVFTECLAALRPGKALHVSTDAIEGTARGAWLLARSASKPPWQVHARRVAAPADAATVQAHHQRWLATLEPDGPGLKA
jgi:sugar (pentulose or hexulose) kinase